MTSLLILTYKMDGATQYYIWYWQIGGYYSTITVVNDTDLIMTKNSPTPVNKWHLSSPSVARSKRGTATLLSLLHLYQSR